MYRVSPENPGKLGVVDANGNLMAIFEPKFTVTETVTTVVVDYVIENSAGVSLYNQTPSPGE